MNVDRIQNTNTAFGARILLKGDKVKRLVNYENKQWAREVLDKFEKFHPEDIVQISCKNITSHWQPYKSALYAENITTGKVVLFSVACKKDIKNLKNDHKCNSLYKFLEELVDTNHFDIFWKNESKAAEEYTNTDLAKHSVFIR